MACSSSSSLVLTAINATLEDASFRTGSEVAADALKSAQTFKNWYESDEYNFSGRFFCLALALPQAVELNFQ